MTPQILKISENKRFLVRDDGTPFFYLGDTAWELFHRLDRENAAYYLEKRAAQGYTVIQAVVLAELDGLNEPNALGAVPLVDNDPARPNEPYFQHVDWIVQKAASLGLTIGMLPTWGDKVVTETIGKGPQVLNDSNAETFGEFLGKRYADSPVIWILGGDRNPINDTMVAVWRALARGLKKGDGGRHLKTYHPRGGVSSADFLHSETWLDFNMMQSGHDEEADNHYMIESDYARTPIKPCFDGEPAYEAIPRNFNPKCGYHDDDDVRHLAYRAVFAGAHGHTYGCNAVWQMYTADKEPCCNVRIGWKEALDLPGAGQMVHLRRLIESRPMLTRIPDQDLLLGDPGTGRDHLRATSGDNRSYAFVYFPNRRRAAIRLGLLQAPRLRVSWYDPRTGMAKGNRSLDAVGVREFLPPPSEGPDSVLVLDAEDKGYQALPGLEGS